MKHLNTSLKILFLFFFSASLWLCNDDNPAGPSYTADDLTGTWIINRVKGVGKADIYIQFSIIEGYTQEYDTTMRFDTTIVLSSDTNYISLYPDSTYNLSIDSSIFETVWQSLTEGASDIMFKKSDQEAVAESYVDTGSWSLNSNTLRCSSYVNNNLTDLNIALSDNSLTLSQHVDSSISLDEIEGFALFDPDTSNIDLQTTINYYTTKDE